MKIRFHFSHCGSWIVMSTLTAAVWRRHYNRGAATATTQWNVVSAFTVTGVATTVRSTRYTTVVVSPLQQRWMSTESPPEKTDAELEAIQLAREARK